MAEPAGFGRTGYLPPQIVGAAAAMSPRMRSMTAGSVVRPGSGV